MGGKEEGREGERKGGRERGDGGQRKEEERERKGREGHERERKRAVEKVRESEDENEGYRYEFHLLIHSPQHLKPDQAASEGS